MRRILLWILLVIPFLLGTLMFPNRGTRSVEFPTVVFLDPQMMESFFSLGIETNPIEKEYSSLTILYSAVELEDLTFSKPPLDYTYYPGTDDIEVMTPEFFIADDTLFHTYELGPVIQTQTKEDSNYVSLSVETSQKLEIPFLEPIFGREFEYSLGFPLTFGWNGTLHLGMSLPFYEVMTIETRVYYEVSHFEIWELDPFVNDYIGEFEVRRPLGLVTLIYGG